MQLSSHDLSQLDEEELLKLPEEALRRLSIRLLNDLKEARERLNRNSRNSSRPPSSEAPWEKERSTVDSDDALKPAKDAESKDEVVPEPSKDCDRGSQAVDEKGTNDQPRKAGKQPGAQGFGRQQSLPVTAYQEHFPENCARCGQPLNADGKKAWTAFDTIDIEKGDENRPGVHLTNIRHTYYEISCTCGHVTRMEPYRNTADDRLPLILCSQWRLVGPDLAALIVCLAYRACALHANGNCRISKRLAELTDFCRDHQQHDLPETGAAAMPIENERQSKQ
ncbi:MAG: DUF6444 domain-containing protein [Blastocatellia bacterium]